MAKEKVTYQLWEDKNSLTLATKEHIERQSWVVGATEDNPKLISEYEIEYKDLDDLNTQLDEIKLNHIKENEDKS